MCGWWLVSADLDRFCEDRPALFSRMIDATGNNIWSLVLLEEQTTKPSAFQQLYAAPLTSTLPFANVQLPAVTPHHVASFPSSSSSMTSINEPVVAVEGQRSMTPLSPSFAMAPSISLRVDDSSYDQHSHTLPFAQTPLPPFPIHQQNHYHEEKLMPVPQSSHPHTAAKPLTFERLPSTLVPSSGPPSIVDESVTELFQYLPLMIRDAIVNESKANILCQSVSVQLCEIQFMLGQSPMLKLSNDEWIDLPLADW
jgi:hypothetical protein